MLTIATTPTRPLGHRDHTDSNYSDHLDNSHRDHTDANYQDSTGTNTHRDHTDVIHSDHADGVHIDAHSDSTPPHVDSHTDEHTDGIPSPGHVDLDAHTDTTHFDVNHGDSHGDSGAAWNDWPHRHPRRRAWLTLTLASVRAT